MNAIRTTSTRLWVIKRILYGCIYEWGEQETKTRKQHFGFGVQTDTVVGQILIWTVGPWGMMGISQVSWPVKIANSVKEKHWRKSESWDYVIENCASGVAPNNTFWYGEKKKNHKGSKESFFISQSSERERVFTHLLMWNLSRQKDRQIKLSSEYFCSRLCPLTVSDYERSHACSQWDELWLWHVL